jgi:hypothetical protein
METVRDIVEEIVNLVDDAETQALIGNRMSALTMMRKADELYNQFESFIMPFEDTDGLATRIATIVQNLCTEATAYDYLE